MASTPSIRFGRMVPRSSGMKQSGGRPRVECAGGQRLRQAARLRRTTVRGMTTALSGAALVLAAGMAGQGQAPAAADPVAQAAEALGGRARILSLRTLVVEGYGQAAQQNGGGNVTSSPDAPQKWQNLNGYTRTVDLTNGRMRVRQRQS